MAIRSRLVRTDLLAFAYVRGYRRPALAVFGGLVVLWRRDRAAAQAVIRHELAHVHQGDSLLLGAVSSFEAILRRWGWILLAFVVAPMVVVWTAQVVDLLSHVGSAGVGHTIDQFLRLMLPGGILQLVITTAQVLPAVITPIAASWSAELAADQVSGISPEVLRTAASPRSGGPFSWLLSRTTHPPASLRRALAGRGETTRLLVPILTYPAAWLLQLGCGVVWTSAIFATAALESSHGRTGTGLDHYGKTLGQSIASWGKDRVPYVVVALVVVAGWYVIRTWWPRLFLPRAHVLRPREPAAPVIAVTALLLAVQILGLMFLVSLRQSDRATVLAMPTPTPNRSALPTATFAAPDPTTAPPPESMAPGIPASESASNPTTAPAAPSQGGETTAGSTPNGGSSTSSPQVTSLVVVNAQIIIPPLQGVAPVHSTQGQAHIVNGGEPDQLLRVESDITDDVRIVKVSSAADAVGHEVAALDIPSGSDLSVGDFHLRLVEPHSFSNSTPHTLTFYFARAGRIAVAATACQISDLYCQMGM